MSKRLIPFVLWFFALTLPLSWLWWFEGLGALYGKLLLAILDGVFDVTRAGAPTGSAAAARFVSVIPFLVLMGVTPGLGWRRRLWGSLAGFALLVVVHLLLLAIVDATEAEFGRGTESVARFFPFLIIADGAPLLIWLFLARDFLKTVVPGLAESTRAGGSG